MIKELKLLIPSPSLFWTALWYWPGAFGYHLIYLKQLMSSDYSVAVSGPSIMRKRVLRDTYPDVKPLHG